jgi:hypothetical protein
MEDIEMSKKCFFCNDGVLYPDTVAECPKCSNYLRKANIEGNSYQKEPGSSRQNSYHKDPYSEYHNTDNNSDAAYRKQDSSTAKIEPETACENTQENMGYSSLDAYSQYQTNSFNNQNESRALKKKARSVDVEGIVKNVMQEDIPSFKISRWFEALFMGVPYVNNNVRNIFQLYQSQVFDSQDCETCRDIIVYGKLTHGRMPENNKARVWGKEDGRGAVRAYKIQNLNSGTEVGVNLGISSGLAWVITVLLLAVIGFIGYQASKVNWTDVFVNILIIVVIAFIAISWVKSKFSRKRR